jgi:DNA repair protein RecO (recombination protein O)
MEEKVKGIVLGGTAFLENDKILNIFTLEQGVISAKIKGVKKAGAKLKFASEPFCFAEFLFSKKGELRTVTGASLIDSFYPVREDIVKYFCASTVVEFVKKFFRENEETSSAFFLTVNALKQISYDDKNPKETLIKFLFYALKEGGYGLYAEDCAKCNCGLKGRVFFDYKRGAFFCEKCFDGEGREINLSTFEGLNEVLKENSVEDEIRTKILRLLAYYIENRTEEKINSLVELTKNL